MENPRGRPFQPGNQFGRGRPPGSRNKSRLVWQQMLEEHGEALIKKCMCQALQGDRAAMRICMERLVPPRKQQAVKLRLPTVTGAADVATAVEAVLNAVSRGQLTTAEGQEWAALLGERRRAIESEGFDARLRVLEQQNQSSAS